MLTDSRRGWFLLPGVLRCPVTIALRHPLYHHHWATHLGRLCRTSCRTDGILQTRRAPGPSDLTVDHPLNWLSNPHLELSHRFLESSNFCLLPVSHHFQRCHSFLQLRDLLDFLCILVPLILNVFSASDQSYPQVLSPDFRSPAGDVFGLVAPQLSTNQHAQ